MQQVRYTAVCDFCAHSQESNGARRPDDWGVIRAPVHNRLAHERKQADCDVAAEYDACTACLDKYRELLGKLITSPVKWMQQDEDMMQSLEAAVQIAKEET